MKNKAFLIILFSFVLCFSLHAAESLWFQTTSDEGSPTTLNVFDLDDEDPMYLPKRSSTWQNRGNKGNSDYGTISLKNYLGKFTVQDCDHRIKFTVSTSGKFVSNSDPTKYRDFCVALSPRCKKRNSNGNPGSDFGFFWDVEKNSAVNPEERLPNTRETGTVSCVTQITDGRNVYYSSGSRMGLYSFWFDILICMDAANSEDYKHMIEGDDYYATIDFTWECYENNCNSAAHSGSYQITLRGFYGNFSSGQDDFNISVTPSPYASNLDILKIIDNSGYQDISSIVVKSTPKSSSSAWNNIYVFLSSSDSYSSRGGSFVLTNRADPSKTIGYTVSIYNEDGTTLNNTYDGTQYFSGNNANQKKNNTKKLNLGSFQTTKNRNNTTFYYVNYLGTAKINILNGTTIKNNTEYYAGIYESTIYYHIVYDN